MVKKIIAIISLLFISSLQAMEKHKPGSPREREEEVSYEDIVRKRKKAI